MRTLLTGLALAIALPAPATGHIVFADPKATAGGYHAGFLRVSHGCGTAATTALRVEIPASVTSAHPQPKPGWTLTIDHQPLATPIRSESGELIRTRVSAITWTGNLPADQFDQFGIMMKLPGRAGPLYFPTTQRCTTATTAWTTIPSSPAAWHATDHPAPILMLVPAAAAGHAMH